MSDNEINLPKETLDRMFTDLRTEVQLEVVTGRDKEFTESLWAYYTDRGRLTPKQQFYFKKLYLKFFGEMP